MRYLGLDSVAENITPQQIVTDMRSVGAGLIGLYFFNNDVQNPGAVVKDAAFVQQVEQLYGQPCVLPICTIASNTAPLPGSLVQDLLAWFPHAGRRVAHDLQTTAFPSQPEMASLFQAEKAAGFSPGIYGNQSAQDTYAPTNPDWQWGVQAYAEGFDYLPAPYKMWQYTNNILSYTYDGNTVDDAFNVVAGPGVTAGEDAMAKQLVIPDPANRLQHFLFLVPFGDGSAQLYYRSFDDVKGGYTQPVGLPGRLADGAGVSAEIDTTANQLQAVCRFADTSNGTVAHFWMPLPSGAWASDTL